MTEPSGWRELPTLLADFWRKMRAGPQPVPVLYIACDGCGNVTPHRSVQKIISITSDGVTASPPETVCGACQQAQPRTVDDEVAADTTVACAGHQFRRVGLRRRRPCGRSFSVPAAASLVVCPWCVTPQPGPGA